MAVLVLAGRSVAGVPPHAAALLAQALVPVLRQEDGPGLSGVDAVLTDVSAPVTAGFLAGFPDLRFVLTASTGKNHVDVAACAARGVEVVSAGGANAESVAEFAVAQMTCLMRGVASHAAGLRAGRWEQRQGLTFEGVPVGLVGCGHIGREIARKLAAFRAGAIWGYDPHVSETNLSRNGIRKAGLDEVFANCRAVFCQVPSLPETRGLVGAAQFGKLVPGSFFVNVGRGETVDESALLAALENGTLEGAACDVFQGEPAPRADLLAHPRLVSTPHVASYTRQDLDRLYEVVVREYLRRSQSSQPQEYVRN